MSKPQLKEMHAKAYSSKGLLNNAKILSETIAFFVDVKRFESFYASLEDWQRICLFLIYRSESRGLEMNEIRLAVPTEKREAVEMFLFDAAKDLYIWRRKNDYGAYTYLGFEDFLACLLPREETKAPAEAKFFSYEDMLIWHLCEMLSFVRLGKMKMNGTGNLHRRSLQICEEAFAYSKALSPDVARDEPVVLMEFLSDNHWIVQRGSELNVTDEALEFLRHNGFRLRNEFLEWWISRRFHGDVEFFKHILLSIKNDESALSALRLLWILDPSTRLSNAAEFDWNLLPKPLGELWLMGMLDFSVSRGAVAFVRLSSFANEWLFSTVSPMLGAQVSSLPNFELIVSVKSAPRVLFMAASLAEIKNDEPYLRFAITRDSYLAGLKTGFDKTSAENFETWIGAPVNVSSAMKEWAACYFDSSFSTVRFLKIANAETREALCKFPQFMEMVDEAVSGYGFIIKVRFETKIRELLKHYGLEPAAIKEEEPVQAFRSTDWNKAFWLKWTENGTPDYAFKPELDGSSVSIALDSTKYGGDFQKFEMFDLFKVLRYARSMNATLEAHLREADDKFSPLPPEAKFKIEELHLSKVPFMAKAMMEPDGNSFDLPLSSIVEIRLLRSKA
ncbi:MAG: hypothetical protein WCR04_05590 [Fibrobacteraceae bacterium]